MELPEAKFYRVLAPRPAILVSTVSSKGISNAAPFSFVMPVSIKPPLVAIASQPSHHTMKNIEELGEFVINIASEQILDNLWECSKKHPEEVSEIKEADLTEVKSKKVKVPRIKECIGWFECRVKFKKRAGDHIIIIGEVVQAEVEDDYWVDGAFDILGAKPLLHLSGKNFAVASEIKTVEG